MKLFESARLGPLQLRNRIVMPPMASLFGNPDGTVSDRLLAYYRRRAHGGVGLIIVENTAVQPGGVNYPGTLEIHDPRFEPGLARLAAAIKSEGAAAAIQLFHPGRQIHPKYRGNYPIAPSPIPCPVMGGNPKELSLEEIEGLVESFADAAARAQAAGFDAIEIHGAHGYLVSQFLSPFSNHRTDRYGGDARRRAQFCVEIVAAIRARVGGSFPIILRISAEDKVEGGLTLAECREMVLFLTPGLTALHVSAGCYPSMEWVVQPYLQPRACLAGLAKAVRETAGVPIIAVGRINDAGLAESILAEGAADFIAMGRALIADPDLPRKAREGKSAEVRPCLACNVCIEAVGIKQTRCAVNPEMGREHEPAPARAAKKILVVGGGPAGMEAALRARSRGCQVWLYEADSSLGGQLISAGVPDSKIEVRRLLDYYRGAIAQSGVTVKLNQRVDAETIKQVNPDLVILATGAAPATAQFAARDNGKIVQALDVLRERRELLGGVVVVGGGPVGLDVAGYLAARGAKVTVLEMNKRAGGILEWNVIKMTLAALKAKGVSLRTKAKVLRLEPGRVVYADQDGSEPGLEADWVVLAVGMESQNPLEELVRKLGIEVRVIGDSQGCRGLAGAVADGFAAGTEG